MAKFRKKPIIIEAIQWNGSNFDEIMNFMHEDCGNKLNYENYEEGCLKTKEIHVKTLEGRMTASKGDWIIQGVHGEFYPCKPDIFKKSYESVPE